LDADTALAVPAILAATGGAGQVKPLLRSIIKPWMNILSRAGFRRDLSTHLSFYLSSSGKRI